MKTGELKKITTDTYEIRHWLETGYEELEGINGNSDPFMLEFPSLLDIGIMGKCNNNCKFCYQGDSYDEHMSLDNFKKIIDECKDFTNQCALGGKGDPNKHPNIKEILEYSVKNKVTPNYTTSGIDLTDEEVGITKKYVGAAAVSMHSKDYTFNALNKFIDAGVKTNIHFVLSKETYTDALRLTIGGNPWKDKLDLNKINGIVFLLFKKQGHGKNLENFSLNKEELKLFLNLFIAHDAFRQHTCMLGLDPCLVNVMKRLDIKFTELQEQCVDTCEGARMGGYISPDMKFAPCSFGGKEVGQSIIDSSIREIWNNGKEVIDFRDKLIKDPYCCPYDLIDIGGE